MTDWHELERKYYMQLIVRIPLTLVKGEGARVWDDKGREYLDFVGGLAVNSLGHCPPVLTEAVTGQVHSLVQTSNWFYTVPQIQLAQLLVENSCLDKVFLCNSGLEANEGAVKLARRYGKLKLNGAYEVITTINSFHGCSLAMTAASGQPKFQEPYIPLPAGFTNVSFNDIEAIMSATKEETCAVMLELIQGEGGANVPDGDYFMKVRKWCDQKGILLILDEIQTGVCRLGSLFGYELYGVEPDILTLAKGLGSGMPIGALLAKERAVVFAVGDHGSTFGGNLVTCTAAYAVLKYIIDNDIAANVRKVGQYLLDGMRGLQDKYSFITDVRGRGLLLAMEFHSDMAQDILISCLEKGLLVNRVKPNAVRLIPPLIIGNAEVDRALGILDKAITGIVS
ncbi:aspartate aminotransferase family protein [Chloroflexota bacterium]